MDEINILINYIQKKYDEVSNGWKKDIKYYPLNMKSSRVENIYKDEKLLEYVFNYRNYISENTASITQDIENLNILSSVNTRVKALNSIQDKIEKYEKKKEEGKIPIKKCLNDIFGLRIILGNTLSHESIKKYIENNFPKLKCIIAFRGNYKATHVYFGNDDNTKFQWELQIWNKIDERDNLISHAKHKQEYTKWERI